jgi:metal-dependent HD superfamily phosphatase/phosphodiesterase
MARTALLALTALAALAGRGVAQTDPRARIFVERGCRDCHAVSALHVKASADVGPDLTYAYGDVLRRYGLNLEAFMANPTGVMRLMLASHIRLSAVDRDSVVQILRGLYEERRADAETGVPSLPRTPACWR